IHMEFPWFSKYWTPRCHKTPPKASGVNPPSSRQSSPDQGSVNKVTAQQHAASSSSGPPHNRNHVGQPSASPEYIRGPPPGFPPPVFNPQAGWQPSPPRMPPQPVGMNGPHPSYNQPVALGPPHYQPPVPFHHQIAQISGQPHAQGGLPPTHHFNQGFQPYGPPQWQHGPPQWHHGPPPPFHGHPPCAGHQPQSPLEGRAPFYNQRSQFGNSQPPMNPEVQTRQPFEQGTPKAQSLPHSGSSSSDGSIRINLPGMSPEKPAIVQATDTENIKKTSSGNSGGSPDEPSTPTNNVSPRQGQRLDGISEKTVQEGETANEGAITARSACFSIQDVRFDQDFSGTVRIRPNRRNQHQRLPSEWLSTGNRNPTPVEQDAQPGPKKGKNKRKAGTRSSSRPSTPVDSSSNQPSEFKAQASAKQSEPVKENAGLQVPGPKGYRADAGGSLKMSRHRKGPAIHPSLLAGQGQSPLNDGSPEEEPAAIPVANGHKAEQPITTKEARFTRFDSMGSIPGCPVLPRACDLFPNYPDLSTSPPKIVMTPAETAAVEGTAPRLEARSLTNGLNGMHRVSDSSVTGHSYCPSFYSAKSTLSSRENSPPEAKDELFVSPPETPTKQSTASRPSSATLSAHPSPKTATTAPAEEPPTEPLKEDAGKSDIKPEAKTPEPVVSKSETSHPEAPKPDSSNSDKLKAKKNSRKNKNNKKAKAVTEAVPSSSEPHEHQPAAANSNNSESKPNTGSSSRPATPVENSSRNNKKRKAQAKTLAERKHSAAATAS
ncbi:hypothetical protein B0T21DRAFT_255714, partial [Apiosordaria backusii]